MVVGPIILMATVVGITVVVIELDITLPQALDTTQVYAPDAVAA